MISTGSLSFCGVRVDGTLWCWGENNKGQLGLGDRRSHPDPTRVGDSTEWQSVSAGAEHTCAVRTDQSLWCWGSNQLGELGVGGRSAGPIVPTQVTHGGHGGWLSVSAGAQYTCAVDRTHRYWCWGSNANGDFGAGTSGGLSTRPSLVGKTREWASVSVSDFDTHTCGTTLGGALYCWGNNHNGQLGVGSTRRHTRPVQVGASSDWSAVSLGGAYTCATKRDLSLLCWGSAADGELGTGADEDQLIPQQVAPQDQWASVSVGRHHTCATGADGSAWCWGLNTDGEVGDGTTTTREIPVRIGDGAAHWASVAAGGYLSAGVQTNATGYTWGAYDGQFGSLVPVQVR